MIPMELSKRTPETWCATAGKQRHATKAEALKHRGSVAANRDRSRMGTFRCSYCDGYHIGRR